MEEARKEIGFYAETEEDVLSTMFPSRKEVPGRAFGGKVKVDFSLVGNEKNINHYPV